MLPCGARAIVGEQRGPQGIYGWQQTDHSLMVGATTLIAHIQRDIYHYASKSTSQTTLFRSRGSGKQEGKDYIYIYVHPGAAD